MRNSEKGQLSRELVSFAEGYLKDRGINSSGVSLKHLLSDGSDRRLYRLTYDKGSVIIVVNDHPPLNNAGINENDSFYYICCHLKSKGIGTPEIYEYQRDKGWFILEDLGDVHLQDEALKIKHDPVKLEELYKKVLDILPLIQVKGAQGFDTNKIHSVHYDKNFVRQWESGYFFRSFLKGYLNLDIPGDFLEDEFDALADKLSSVDSSFFLYRDFQSKNIMIKQKQIRFLDFQGGRRGPLHYDLSSLLLDPYVNINNKLRQTLIEYYLKQLTTLIPIDKEKFLSEYPFIALHRNLQILGAFGYLTTVKKRHHFKKYIPTAIKGLKDLLNLDIFSPYKNLKKVVKNL
jgi:aminoglycoside/choline kinase family phosphotransferase